MGNKRVKAWAMLNPNGEISVMPSMAEAQWFMIEKTRVCKSGTYYKRVPCQITYQTPKRKKRK